MADVLGRVDRVHEGIIARRATLDASDAMLSRFDEVHGHLLASGPSID